MENMESQKIKINSNLSELAGIHAGDGYLRYLGKRKELDISGSIDEKNYYDSNVIPLINNLFNLSTSGKFFKSRNTYGVVVRDKNVLQVLANLGFPSGKKTTIVKIPQVILESENNQIIISFLRGYFDSDGSVTFCKKIGNSSHFQQKYNYYPRIMFTCCSKYLTMGFVSLAEQLGFSCSVSYIKSKKPTENDKYKIQIVGKESILKWMDLIQPKNHSKVSRFLIWKKYGFCPPNTTYEERTTILEGNLDPYSFYEKSGPAGI
jgi:hypothetical protein